MRYGNRSIHVKQLVEFTHLNIRHKKCGYAIFNATYYTNRWWFGIVVTRWAQSMKLTYAEPG